MKYLAYGSNLSIEQMDYRCSDAKIVGKAVLKDWKLVFRYHATIEPCAGCSVPVLVWEISPRDEKRLDRYEGFPKYYVKRNVDVEMTDLDGKNPRKVMAMVYIMAEGSELQAPSETYYGTIAEGYDRLGFDKKILEEAIHDCD